MIKEKIVLSDVQIQWLKKHFKHTKNDVIRERLGLSHSTLHRIARELGLKKTRQFMAKMQMAASMAGKAAIAAEDEAAKKRGSGLWRNARPKNSLSSTQRERHRG